MFLHEEVKGLNLLPGEYLSEEHRGQLVGFRPETVMVKNEEVEGYLPVEVLSTRWLPDKDRLHLEVNCRDQDLSILTDTDREWAAGSRVWIRPETYFIFDGNSGGRIGKAS